MCSELWLLTCLTSEQTKDHIWTSHSYSLYIFPLKINYCGFQRFGSGLRPHVTASEHHQSADLFGVCSCRCRVKTTESCKQKLFIAPSDHVFVMDKKLLSGCSSFRLMRILRLIVCPHVLLWLCIKRSEVTACFLSLIQLPNETRRVSQNFRGVESMSF